MELNLRLFIHAIINAIKTWHRLCVECFSTAGHSVPFIDTTHKPAQIKLPFHLVRQHLVRIYQHANPHMRVMRSMSSFATLRHVDPMRYIYILYCLFLSLALVGAVCNIRGLWGSAIGAFCLVGFFVCYRTIRETKIRNIDEEGGC